MRKGCIVAVEGVLKDVRIEIINLLKDKMKDDMGLKVNASAGMGNGKYSCYQWVQVERKKVKRM